MSRYLVGVLTILSCAGCRYDMQNQPKYTPLARSWFYADGRSARPIPPGTIAIDEVDIDPVVATGMANGTFVSTIPVPLDGRLLARGQDRFNVYCSPCHSKTGDGDGMIARRGFKDPANLNSDHVKNAPPGYLYSVIVNGYRAMAGYSYQIKDVRDRWAIVAYIRALELSRGASMSDAPPAEQRRLEAEK